MKPRRGHIAGGCTREGCPTLGSGERPHRPGVAPASRWRGPGAAARRRTSGQGPARTPRRGPPACGPPAAARKWAATPFPATWGGGMGAGNGGSTPSPLSNYSKKIPPHPSSAFGAVPRSQSGLGRQGTDELTPPWKPRRWWLNSKIQPVARLKAEQVKKKTALKSQPDHKRLFALLRVTSYDGGQTSVWKLRVKTYFAVPIALP